MSWTDDMLTTAITMAHQGHCARDIAHVVGKTKDAVVNKLSRSGHPLSGIIRLRRPQVEMRREAQNLAPPELEERQDAADASKPVTFETLEPWHCKWPLGEIADPVIFFCGERRVKGSYCQAHAEISRNGTPTTGRKFAMRRRKAA
jgi:hypothetical protein